MKKNDYILLEYMAWETMFKDNSKEKEQDGCTPILVGLGLVSIALTSLGNMDVWILSNLTNILMTSLGLTFCIPLLGYQRSRCSSFGLGDIVYVIFKLINLVVGALVGYGLMMNVITLEADTGIIKLLSLYLMGLVIFKLVQSVLWSVSIKMILRGRV